MSNSWLCSKCFNGFSNEKSLIDQDLCQSCRIKVNDKFNIIKQSIDNNCTGPGWTCIYEERFDEDK